MTKTVLAALALASTASLTGCIVVDDDDTHIADQAAIAANADIARKTCGPQGVGKVDDDGFSCVGDEH